MTSEIRSCCLDIRPYHRSFHQPLVTSHGEWSVRKGAIVRLSTSEQVGYGELAPIPWLGSETLGEALDFCNRLEGGLTSELLDAVPDSLPATQFALETAWTDLISTEPSVTTSPGDLPVCGLLPTGKAALQEWTTLVSRGYSTLKWKVGVADRTSELQWLQQLREALPSNIALRLDANGGLDTIAAVEWLHACDRLSIEFLEQPLPPAEFQTLLALNREFATPLALDESVATLRDLRQTVELGWTGIVVIKPSICGFPSRVQQFCSNHQLDVVLSSALETPIGQRAAQTLAGTIRSRRAIGFGADHLLQPVPDSWPACLWQTSTP